MHTMQHAPRTSALTLAEWDALDETQQLAIARNIERLQPRARFLRLERIRHPLAERTVALFDVDGVTMALIPGGPTTLGLATPTLEPAALGAIGEILFRFAQSMSPSREAVLAPFLLEREATLRPFSADDDIPPDAHAALVEHLAAEGFRLPTSDEWEHASTGGVRTLFRWGDGWPRSSVLASSPADTNAFGLAYTRDPYATEVTADPNELRNGDGGEAACGGYGPIEWLPLASAYRFCFDKMLAPTDDRSIWFLQSRARRALSLD